MKKPNITKGEWKEVAPNAVGIITIEEDICYVANTKNDNMKAISAVPEMLDALINTYRYFNKREKPTQEDYMKMHGKIRKALKKAGCE